MAPTGLTCNRVDAKSNHEQRSLSYCAEKLRQAFQVATNHWPDNGGPRTEEPVEAESRASFLLPESLPCTENAALL
jgi:hypothetical protein